MKRAARIVAGALVLALLVAGGAGLYMLGRHQGMAVMDGMNAMDGMAEPAGATPAPPTAGGVPPEEQGDGIAAGEAATRRHIEQGLRAGEVDPASGRRILYYHDPMVPGRRFEAPARSPFMDMMLVPVYADTGTDTGRVTVSPRIQQNLGVRTAPAAEGVLRTEVNAVGSIAWNERDQSVLQARAAGYIEKLHVRATLDRVQKGQPIAELYVPAWVAAQEEFLAVRRAAGGDAALLDAARNRMRLAGMNAAQIARVEAGDAVRPRITLAAPSSGVIAELPAREGMAVSEGTLLARINGLATVWALAEVPESQAALLGPGSAVEARAPGVPGRVFEGKVQALLPRVDAATRTLTARIELANPGFALAPGMFVELRFTDERAGKPRLLVPTEAVIRTGRRSLVMLAEGGGRFRPVEVETGLESGGQTEITRGLQAGQEVVVSSQFLIDSEASLRGLEARFGAPAASAPATAAPRPGAAAGPERHRGEAVVEAVATDAITLSHGPIESLGMDGMTMEFRPPPNEALPPGLAAGDKVSFEFLLDPKEGPRLTRITPLASPAAGGASR